MNAPHRRQGKDCWMVSLVAGLVLAVAPALSHGLEGPGPPPREGHLAPRRPLSVRQEQLSVDLREAEVGEVLARIGQEAGVVMLGNPTPGARVSAQFMEVELEAGLRRLLRQASMSYAIRYAWDSTGGVTIREVRVFGLANEEPPSP
jgi:hypothetical protein